MTLQYCSDLHLEFPDNRRWLAAHPLIPKANILLLAGDILPFAQSPAQDEFLGQLADTFGQVYWIPGNHEYYGSDINERSGSFTEKIRSNLTLLNNTVVEIQDVRLIFTTLWSQISPDLGWRIERSLNDYFLIRHGDRKLQAGDTNQLHAESLAFIKAELARPTTKKTVVVTHHVPTLKNYPSMYRNSPLNQAFATELYDMIYDSTISHWIFGHHHYNRSDFLVGRTTLTTNQLGYVKNHEYRGFSLDRTIGL